MRNLIAVIGVAGVVAACTVGSLRKPEIYAIKKVAVVSIYANSALYNYKDKNSLKADYGGDHLIRYSLKSFEREFAKINNWEVMPTKSVVVSEAYKAYLQKQESGERGIASAAVKEWKFLKGMVPYYGEFKKSKIGDTKELQALAQGLGVDAVAVIKLDFAYEPSVGTEGMKASVASAIKMVNAKGEIVLLTSGIDVEKNRYHSEQALAMNFASFSFGDKEKQMYTQAVDRAAEGWQVAVNQDWVKK